MEIITNSYYGNSNFQNYEMSANQTHINMENFKFTVHIFIFINDGNLCHLDTKPLENLTVLIKNWKWKKHFFCHVTVILATNEQGGALTCALPSTPIISKYVGTVEPLFEKTIQFEFC